MLRIRSFGVLSTVIVLAGCYSYRVVPLASIAPKSQIRVTTSDGRRMKLEDVTVASDSVRGYRPGQRWLWSRHGSVALAAADVAQVEVPRLDLARSVVAYAVGTGIVVYTVSWVFFVVVLHGGVVAD